MSRELDLSVYLVTDRACLNGRELLDVVAKAVRGGVNMVQLREKHCDTREFLELGRALKQMLHCPGVPLIINDRVDIALALGCEGVHVGQSDMPYPDVRRLMGPDAIIGLSIDDLSQLDEARDFDVDYLGVGPIFPTATKPDAGAPIGLKGLTEARCRTRLPIVAIGAIDTTNAEAAIRAGADGVAVVSALCSAKSPENTARELSKAVKKGRI